MESRVDLFALIRRDDRVKGLSVRAQATKHGVHRRTVRQALESATPPDRKPRRGVSWRLEAFKPVIDATLPMCPSLSEACLAVVRSRPMSMIPMTPTRRTTAGDHADQDERMHGEV
jgi:transposase